jgi:hypothetical protein
VDGGTQEAADRDSGYNSDRTDVTITKDTDNYFTVEVNGARRRV